MFKAGMQLAAVHLKTEPEKEVWYSLRNTNPYSPVRAKEIVVVDVPGMMSNVPWAKVTKANGVVTMVNLLLCEEVELMSDKGGS